jgi:hypothetical protein
VRWLIRGGARLPKGLNLQAKRLRWPPLFRWQRRTTRRAAALGVPPPNYSYSTALFLRSLGAVPNVRLGGRFGVANERAAKASVSLVAGSALSGASPHQASLSHTPFQRKGPTTEKGEIAVRHNDLSPISTRLMFGCFEPVEKLRAGFSHFDAVAWLQDRDFRFAFGETGKLFRVTNQRWECTVVDGNHYLRMEEFDGLGRVFGSHNEMLANR